uniref:Uncharacterized protein n=1 Tax=Oryza sativa subsp. japonica TaxID=39947 RepID=Q69W94_ORYSJ|nr:hypothetical protein [Oryza sativa Japonica Group]
MDHRKEVVACINSNKKQTRSIIRPRKKKHARLAPNFQSLHIRHCKTATVRPQGALAAAAATTAGHGATQHNCSLRRPCRRSEITSAKCQVQPSRRACVTR